MLLNVHIYSVYVSAVYTAQSLWFSELWLVVCYKNLTGNVLAIPI